MSTNVYIRTSFKLFLSKFHVRHFKKLSQHIDFFKHKYENKTIFTNRKSRVLSTHFSHDNKSSKKNRIRFVIEKNELIELFEKIKSF